MSCWPIERFGNAFGAKRFFSSKSTRWCVRLRRTEWRIFFNTIMSGRRGTRRGLDTIESIWLATADFRFERAANCSPWSINILTMNRFPKMFGTARTFIVSVETFQRSTRQKNSPWNRFFILDRSASIGTLWNVTSETNWSKHVRKRNWWCSTRVNQSFSLPKIFLSIVKIRPNKDWNKIDEYSVFSAFISPRSSETCHEYLKCDPDAFRTFSSFFWQSSDFSFDTITDSICLSFLFDSTKRLPPESVIIHFNVWTRSMDRLFSFVKPTLPVPAAVALKIFLSILLGTTTIYLLSNISTVKLPTTSIPLPQTSASRIHPHIAVIVEFRTVDHLVAVVHNVNHHIPSSWPIQIFHGTENEPFIRNSTLAPLIHSGKIFLTLMSRTYDRGQTNTLLTDRTFWERVRGEKILFFQIDSMMCSNSPHRVTDFLQYDYVGAPWDLSFFTADKQYRVGNGGFSLRTRSKLLELLALIPYDRKLPEDVWYAQNLRHVNGSIPSIEIAQKFAVESMFYERPVGIHRFPWHCKFRADLARTCPESMLVMLDVCH